MGDTKYYVRIICVEEDDNNPVFVFETYSKAADFLKIVLNNGYSAEIEKIEE